MKRNLSISLAFCVAGCLVASLASGQAVPKLTSTEVVPLSPAERTELEIYRRQSVTVHKAVGWRRILELFRPTLEKTKHQYAIWEEEQKGKRVPVPASVMRVEGLSLKRFAVAQFPFEKQPLEFTYTLSPDHLALAHFTQDTDGFVAGSGIEVEAWGNFVVGDIVRSLDLERDKKYISVVFDPAYTERYGLMTYDLYTKEPKEALCGQFRPMGKKGFEAKWGGGTSSYVLPMKVAFAARDHFILEFSRAIQIARKKAEAEKQAGVKDDDNYEFLNVPLAIEYDGHVVSDAMLDRMELDAHRRYFALLASVLH
jgi:hypothetical protein